MFGVYDPKRCIFKAFPPVFSNFRRISLRQEGSEAPPPRKFFLEFMTQKDAFLRPVPRFYIISDGRGVGRPSRETF